ncbi:MAG: hypothetical protein ACLFQ6_07070 [Candidatus Sumerlaeia bacterium]
MNTLAATQVSDYADKKWARRFSFRAIAMLTMICILGVTLLSGCALIQEENRRLTQAVADVIPESTKMKIATFPLWGLAGLCTLIIDGFIINPVFKANAAIDDAIDWAFLGFGTFLPAEIILIIPRVVAAVVIFIVSDILRCTIPYLFLDD